MKKLILPFLTLFILWANTQVNAQLRTPQPSPLCKLNQAVGLTEITITYSRPSAKGRVIFGDIVPFDKIWRTGANRPTKVKLDDDMMIDGKKIAKGEYSLMTIPGKTEWTIIFNKDTKGNGAFTYDAADDVLNFKVKPMSLTQKVETFTISLVEATPNSAMIEIAWENTAVRFKVEQDTDSKIMAEIKKQLDPAKDANLYSTIAQYYLDNNRELPEALKLVNKSLEWSPNRYWIVHLKAKIQHKLNDKTGAIASAEQSKKMAMEEKDDNYVKMNEKLIADLKK
jgi:hypothetical protein